MAVIFGINQDIEYAPEASASAAKIRPARKLFWVAVRRFWFGWQQSLIVVTPETVVRWHRAGFRLYWKLISKVENSTWGAPRIHGELLNARL